MKHCLKLDQIRTDDARVVLQCENCEARIVFERWAWVLMVTTTPLYCKDAALGGWLNCRPRGLPRPPRPGDTLAWR